MLMVITIIILININSTPLTEANITLISGPQTILEFLTPLFGNNLALATIFLVLYLFLTLIVVIFNIKRHHTSLRRQNK